MLIRFALYGFLKNQRYFEPFLVLAFLAKGLSFFEIGLLVGLREVSRNLLEIPSGAVADLWGRRRSMIFSFVAYILSFLLLWAASSGVLLAAAIVLFAAGDAFRTGTHKAMIFTWLRLQGREGERTRIYGFTRSWSKLGSALSVVVGAVLVLIADGYSWIFLAPLVPYALGIINFLGYPRELEGEGTGRTSVRRVWRHTLETLRFTWRRRPLRRLMSESMGYEGTFGALQDYLQPALQNAATVWLVSAGALASLGLAGSGGADEAASAREVALLVGPVYLVLYLISAAASRNAHRLAEIAGGEDAAARWLWWATTGLYGAIALGGYLATPAVVIPAFVGLHVLQNFWRPMLIGRVDAASDEHQGATVLSVESQAKSLATMVLAPVAGLAVDLVRAHGPGGELWPVGALGLAVTAVFVWLRPSRRRGSAR